MPALLHIQALPESNRGWPVVRHKPNAAHRGEEHFLPTLPRNFSCSSSITLARMALSPPEIVCVRAEHFPKESVCNKSISNDGSDDINEGVAAEGRDLDTCWGTQVEWRGRKRRRGAAAKEDNSVKRMTKRSSTSRDVYWNIVLRACYGRGALDSAPQA